MRISDWSSDVCSSDLLAQFWQSGAPALFGGFHQMAMQAEKIQLVHYSAAREYGLKPGHAQLTRFFRDQIDAAHFDGCDAPPEIWNGFERLCLADDVQCKITLPDLSPLGGPFRRADIEPQDDVPFLQPHQEDTIVGLIAIT